MSTHQASGDEARMAHRWLVAVLSSIVASAGGGCDPSPREPSPTFPSWAYAWDAAYQSTADAAPRHVPDSTAAYSLADAENLFLSPDWHVSDHPPMPGVVAHGRRPGVLACGCCHRAEGTGGPENASLAGLPYAYMIEQIADLRSGARRFSGPPRSPVVRMIETAKASSDAEIEEAARYFAGLKPRARFVLREAEQVPRTIVARNFHVPLADGSTEPLGARILELPEDVERFELRDSHVRFIVYVPRGSIARGAALAATGGAGRTLACRGCHGPELGGLGDIPGITRQSPSYVVRQLYDFQAGARAGTRAAAMKPVVAKLTVGDIIDLAAYLTSLAP
jgi:cytochrome c553